MGDREKVIIGTILAIVIVIVKGYLINKQKQEGSLYKNLVKLIDNTSIEKVIERITVLTLNITAILLIALELSIFLPSFKWGWIERESLIALFATILGGFFGFIGAVIGIIGTYGAFYLGVKNEKEKANNYKKLMLFNLLDYTVFKTDSICNRLNDYYKQLIKDAKTKGVDLINIMYTLTGLSEEEIDIGKSLSKDMKIIYLLSNNKQILELIKELNIHFKDDILRQIDLKDFIYDNNWCSYIDCIRDMRKSGGNRSMQRIIDWIGTLNGKDLGHTEYEVINFIMQRECIKGMIDELGKEVKKEGFRWILKEQ